MKNFIISMRHRFPYYFWKELKYKLGLGICYTLIYEMILGFIIYPFLMRMFNSVLTENKFYYITDQNWQLVLAKPPIVICMLIIIFLFLLFGLFQIVSIITLASESDIHSIGKLFIRSLHKMRAGFKVQTPAGKAALFLTYPFINWITIFSMYYKYNFDHILNFGNDKEKWIIFFFMLGLNVPLAFTYPLVFNKKEVFSKALKDGISLFSEKWLKNIGIMVILFIVSLLMPVAAYFLVVGILAFLISLISVDRAAYAYALTTVNSINIIFLYIISIVTSITGAYASVILYEFRTQTKFVPVPYAKKFVKYNIMLPVIVILLFAVSLVSDTYFRNTELRLTPSYSGSVPEVIAHRGLSSVAPENTLSAIKGAIENGADRIEMDVQLTKDGYVVLMHDRNMLRTTGVDNEVGNMNLYDIRQLDAGSWFSEKYKGEMVPILEEVLNACKNKVNLKIELKPENGNEKLLAETVVKKVQDYKMEQSVIISSFSSETIKRVHKLDKTIATGMIVRFAYGPFAQKGVEDTVIMSNRYVSEYLVKKLHLQGKRIFCWTVNTRSEIERLTRLGVDGIITDYPIMARETIYEEKVPPVITQMVENLIQTLSD